MGRYSVRHDLGGAQFVASMDQVNPGGEASQKKRFLRGRVSSTDNTDRHIPVECSVAGGA